MESKIKCPWCDQKYIIDDSYLGQTIKCEKCGTDFAAATIPEKTIPQHGRKKKIVLLSIVTGVFLIVVLLGIFVFPVIKANIDYKRGLTAQKEHRYDAAFELFKKAAEKGHPEAQFELGNCYGTPEGTALDVPEAIKWFRKAAERGHMEAQYRLGKLYQAGVGMNKSETEAAFWFEKASEQGHRDAPYQCGVCYFNPTDHKFDELENSFYRELARSSVEKALPWYEKAADFGSKAACYNVGLFYEYGLGVNRDYKEAAKWFQKAGSVGKNELEICELLLEMEMRDTGSDPEKQYELAEKYFFSGHSTEAVEWYTKSAEQGYLKAQEHLAFSGDVSKSESDKWYQVIRDFRKEQRLKEERQREQEAAKRKAIEEAERKAFEETKRKEEEERKKKEMADDDSDGFTYAQEMEAGTDPQDSLSHPKYMTRVYVSSVGQQSFSGLKFVGIVGKENRINNDYFFDDYDIDLDTQFNANKKKEKVTFQVTNNNIKSLKHVCIGETFKHNNIDFILVDLDYMSADEEEGDFYFYDYSDTLEMVAYLQRMGKKERILCRVGKPVLDPVLRVKFHDDMNGNDFTVSVGDTFKLGDAKTGEEQYKVVSANLKTKEVVVESTGKNKKRYSIKTKDKGSTRRDDSPFLRRE